MGTNRLTSLTVSFCLVRHAFHSAIGVSEAMLSGGTCSGLASIAGVALLSCITCISLFARMSPITPVTLVTR
jgi:hypothetical protein